MAEMGRISRFFVNARSARRNRRIHDWIRSNLSLPAGAECLEIGCGNADMAARLVESFRPAQYIATDLDPRQLDVARRTLAKRYPTGLPEGLELRTADMLRLPFGDGTFDAVFAFVAIHHASEDHHDFTKVPEALAEINRVLRPTGSLVYEEIEHKEGIRKWLSDRGYALSGMERGWKRESVVARKPA